MYAALKLLLYAALYAALSHLSSGERTSSIALLRCVCVCVRVRERERDKGERVLCVYVCVPACVCVYVSF